jgi:hypothetical protein
MKSLDQIASTGIPINAANTPGNGTNQFIISAAGSYYLTGNLNGVSGMNGILINAANVTVDLNGYQMAGINGSLTAITDGGVNHGNATIRNGSIINWGDNGVDLSHSFDSLVSDLIVTNNGAIGLSLGDASVARDCMMRNNNGDNILTGFNANLSHCTAVGSATGNGFDLGQDSTMTDCVANFNAVHGINAALGCQLSRCTANQNASTGISASDGVLLDACLAYNNTSAGIICGAASTLRGCVANNNGNSTTVVALQTSSNCTLVDCTASNNTAQYGLVANPGSTVSHCTASNNTSNQTTSGGILAAGSTITDCTTNGNANTSANPSNNTGMGIYCNGGDSLIERCTSAGNKGDGINVVDRCLVRGNLANDNGAAGVHSTGSGSEIDGNQATNNGGPGIQVDATINLIVRNAARANGGAGNYSVAAGNRVATIFLPTVGSASGNTGGTTFSTDPAANVAY